MSILESLKGTNASNSHDPSPELFSNQGCVAGVGCNGTGLCKGQVGGGNNNHVEIVCMPKNNANAKNKGNSKNNSNNNKNKNKNKNGNSKNNASSKNNSNNKNKNKNKNGNSKNNASSKNNGNNKNKNKNKNGNSKNNASSKNNGNNKNKNKNKNGNSKNNASSKNNKNKNKNKNGNSKNNGKNNGNSKNKTQKGGGYAFTAADAEMAANNGLGYGSMPFSSYSNCGTVREAGLGAGVQYGGGLPLVPANVDSNSMLVANPPAVNNNLRPGYGYVSGKDNLLFAGSGYPLETAYNGNQCAQSGGRRRRRKHKRTRRKHHKKRKKTRNKRRRGGRFKKGTRSKTHRGNNFETRKNSKRYSQKRLKKLTGRRTLRAPVFSFAGGNRVQKGGYHQYGSNVPDTAGFANPNPGPLPWATGPGSYTRQINCEDNYNHFTGRGGPSPVLDKGVSQ